MEIDRDGRVTGSLSGWGSGLARPEPGKLSFGGGGGNREDGGHRAWTYTWGRRARASRRSWWTSLASDQSQRRCRTAGIWRGAVGAHSRWTCRRRREAGRRSAIAGRPGAGTGGGVVSRPCIRSGTASCPLPSASPSSRDVILGYVFSAFSGAGLVLGSWALMAVIVGGTALSGAIVVEWIARHRLAGPTAAHAALLIGPLLGVAVGYLFQPRGGPV